MTLNGKKFVVTGGTGNVGRAVVAAMLRKGAEVFVPTRARSKGIELKEAFPTPNLRVGVVDLRAKEASSNMVDLAGTAIDGVVASLGTFEPLESLLSGSIGAVHRTMDSYLFAHLHAARALFPLLVANGSYTLVNGPLAFKPMFPTATAVSIATAAQAMLAQCLMAEAGSHRVNEVVVYTRFGGGDESADQLLVADLIARIAGPRAAHVRAQSIHLDKLHRIPVQLGLVDQSPAQAT